MIGVGRRTVFDWREKDEDFAERWEGALKAGTDALEDEARRRARDGVEEPVFYQGEVCGHVQKYSDNLLMFLLKARDPQRFKDRVENEHTGNVSVEVIRFTDTTPK